MQVAVAPEDTILGKTGPNMDKTEERILDKTGSGLEGVCGCRSHTRFFDEQLGSAVGAVDYVRRSGN